MTGCPDDDAWFGFGSEGNDPASSAMVAAAEALDAHDIAGAREALDTAGGYQSSSHLAFEALSLLDAGLTDEAARRVALFLSPKFHSIADCEERYALAMGRASSFPQEQRP